MYVRSGRHIMCESDEGYCYRHLMHKTSAGDVRRRYAPAATFSAGLLRRLCHGVPPDGGVNIRCWKRRIGCESRQTCPHGCAGLVENSVRNGCHIIDERCAATGPGDGLLCRADPAEGCFPPRGIENFSSFRAKSGRIFFDISYATTSPVYNIVVYSCLQK